MDQRLVWDDEGSSYPKGEIGYMVYKRDGEDYWRANIYYRGEVIDDNYLDTEAEARQWCEDKFNGKL